MAGQGLPVRLARGVPFVDDVFAVMDGRKSLDAAVTTLLAAERAHGAAIWNETAGEPRLWAGFFVPRDRSSPPSLRTHYGAAARSGPVLCAPHHRGGKR